MRVASRGGSRSAGTQGRLGCVSGPRVRPEPQNTKQTLQGLLVWVRTSATQAYGRRDVIRAAEQHSKTFLLFIWSSNPPGSSKLAYELLLAGPPSFLTLSESRLAGFAD